MSRLLLLDHSTLILPLFLGILLLPVCAGVFSSSADLVHLVNTEAELTDKLETLVLAEHQRLARLETVVADYKALRDSAKGSSELFVGNPLNSFKLIKKLTSEWEMLKDLIRGSADSFLQTIGQERDMNYRLWPSDEDLNGAAIGLIRLQDTYKLSPSALARGVLNEVFYGPNLTSQDCFEVGRQSFNTGDFWHANKWFQEALSLLETETYTDKEKDIAQVGILDYLAFSAYSTGNLSRALEATREMVRIQPNHPRAYNVGIYEAKVAEGGAREEDTVLELKEARANMDYLGSDRQVYESLCRGEETMSLKEKSKMMCRYTTGRHPALLIGPVKEEVVSLEPRIVIFHDLITDAEIQTVKALATPRFQRATIQNPLTGELETAHYRISVAAWLKENEHPAVASIYRRTAAVTGLNMESSEELQVSNYGIGGHYEPHLDFTREEELDHLDPLTGNRIATLLMYYTDVEQGGATVFTELGITVRPAKGSVVFWWNLKANGVGDLRTKHAACPVLKGSKWVSNFWVHERGQEFTRPCTLDQNK